MLVLVLTSLIATTTPETAKGSAPATPPAPVPPSAADTVVAAAFGNDFDTKPGQLKGSTGDSAPALSAQNLLAPALGVLGLAALAFGLKRRKQLRGGTIHIVEAASLGEKRSLVIADVLGERLVLGVSEAGVAVLMNRPAPAPEPAPLAVPRQPAMGFLARLRGKAPTPAFEASLQESLEDQELRAKLAAGMRGVVP